MILAIAAALAAAALAAGPVWAFLSERGSSSGWAARLAEKGPSRVFSRLAMFLLAGVLAVAAYRGGIRRWRDLGWKEPGTTLRDMLLGYGVGILMFGLIGLVSVRLGAREFVPPGWPGLRGELPSYAVAGLLTALFEETVFRGLLLLAAVRAGRPFLGIVGGSVLYATAHWLRLPPETNATGIALLRESFAGLAEVPGAWSHWLALFLVGAALCVTVLRTGRLGWAVGLHAAWVLGLKALVFLTDTRPSEGLRRILLGGDGAIEGLLAGGTMAALALAFLWSGGWRLRWFSADSWG